MQWSTLGATLCAGSLLNVWAQQPQAPSDASSEQGRIITEQEVKEATSPASLAPLRVISWPHRYVTSKMETGLISFEKHRMRERFRLLTEYLRRRGVAVLFGGVGEGTGFGAGGSYTMRTGQQPTLRFLGRSTFKSYQEFDALWSFPLPRQRLEIEASYQWRPQENFYGLGHRSFKGKRSNFALRQTWTGVRWEIDIAKRVGWGTEYKLGWLSASAGTNLRISSPDVFFSNLAGFGTMTRLQSFNTYLNLDFVPSEYAWGGAAHLGASFQDGLGKSRLQYFSYEVRLEGRAPIAVGRSAVVAQIDLELNRERHGSDPIPFYLLPHVGGSSTLRGFALDRFYGANLALAALEYRYRLHPNIQTLLFFDEGQIFNRTSDLATLNWHRNYGIGLRLRSVRGTFLRVEYGYGDEGSRLHITFGDRPRPPLRGPIRYGSYRR